MSGCQEPKEGVRDVRGGVGGEGGEGVEVSTPAQGQRKNDLNIFHFSDICFFNESEDQLHSTLRCRHHRNTDSRKKKNKLNM